MSTQEELLAARKAAAEQRDIGFREASALWAQELRDAARMLRETGKTAYDDGYPDRQIAVQEAAAKVNGVIRGIAALGAKKPGPSTQVSLDLEKAS